MTPTLNLTVSGPMNPAAVFPPVTASPTKPTPTGRAWPNRPADATAARSSLRALWLGALCEEQRRVAPIERFALALTVGVSAFAILQAAAANLRFVEHWPAVAAFVRHLLG